MVVLMVVSKSDADEEDILTLSREARDSIWTKFKKDRGI